MKKDKILDALVIGIFTTGAWAIVIALGYAVYWIMDQLFT